MISVVIPAYNHGSAIAECIDSVLSQPDVELEIIVVNDGSTDNTKAVLLKYEREDRVKVINQANMGSNPARNKGAAEASGEYIIFLDADADLKSDTFVRLTNALEDSPSASYAYCDFIFGWKKFKTGPFDEDRLKDTNYIHTSAMIKRADFPGYDESIKRFQDWDLWLTMLEGGKKGVYVPGFMMQMKVERKGISSWMPKCWYRAPWRWLPTIKERVHEYEAAKEIVRLKHGLLHDVYKTIYG